MVYLAVKVLHMGGLLSKYVISAEESPRVRNSDENLVHDIIDLFQEEFIISFDNGKNQGIRQKSCFLMVSNTYYVLLKMCLVNSKYKTC